MKAPKNLTTLKSSRTALQAPLTFHPHPLAECCRDRDDRNHPSAKSERSRSPGAKRELPEDSPGVGATRGCAEALELTRMERLSPLLQTHNATTSTPQGKRPRNALFLYHHKMVFSKHLLM